MRRLKNEIGRMNGYGCCMSCRDSWSWKEEKRIPYRHGAGMFPICAECFERLSYCEIERYIDILAFQWNRHNPPHISQDEIDQAKASAYLMKGGVHENEVFSRTHGLEMDIHRGRGGQIPRA